METNLLIHEMLQKLMEQQQSLVEMLKSVQKEVLGMGLHTKQYLTADEAAHYLDCHRSHLWTMSNSGLIHVYHPGQSRKRAFYKREELDEFINKGIIEKPKRDVKKEADAILWDTIFGNKNKR